MLNDFTSHRIRTSLWMTEEITVSRTWKERLFSRPWCPWIKIKQISVPSKKILKLQDGTLMMHPALVQELSRQLEGTIK